MQATLRDVEAKHPSLRRPLRRAPFAAATLNLGPATVCWSHRDSGNAIGHMCLDGANGDYDWTAGGHLILHEAQLVIQLRPGDLILFPSALVTHANIPVSAGESRYSLTAYSAGALERYRQQGMQTKTRWRKLAPGAVVAHDQNARARWDATCRMFKTVAELERLAKAKAACALS